MGLSDRLRSALNSLLGKQSDDTETGLKLDRTSFFHAPWARFYQRKATWDDLETMDHDEPIIARGLDFVPRYAIKFTDGVAGGTGAQRDIEATGFVLAAPPHEVAALDPVVKILQAEAFEFVRYMVKFGDGYVEIVVDPQDVTITNLKLFPYSYQLFPNVDKYGAMLRGDPEEAMKAKKSGMAAWDQLDDHGGLIAAFHPYQIAAFSFGHKQGLPYTEPVLGCVISGSKRYRAMKDALSIARLTRAFQKLVHHIPVALGLSIGKVKEAIKQYKENMGADTTIPYDTASADYQMASKESPMAVETDIYLPRFYDKEGRTVDGDVKSVDADSANLENLEDVYLLIRDLVCAMGVPADFLNYAVGQKSFIDKTTPEKREAFLYLACAVQDAWLKTCRQILDIQLLLHGINPLTAKYQLIVPRISPKEAEVAAKIDVQRANTAAIWTKLGIPKAVVGQRIIQLTPGEIAQWIASDGAPPEGVDPDEQMELATQEALRQFGLGETSLPLSLPEEVADRGIVTVPVPSDS